MRSFTRRNRTIQRQKGISERYTVKKVLDFVRALSIICINFMFLPGGGSRCRQPHKIYLLGSSLKKEADETLFLELALRGYDLSSLRDNPTTAEILKIL